MAVTAGHLLAAGHSVTTLRARWRGSSLGGGWSRPRDWWVPEVDEVAQAVLVGEDLIAACGRLGRARAEAGVGLAESLDDLVALAAVLPEGLMPVGAIASLVRALAESWAEAGVAPVLRVTCEDPLTGLATPAHLRTRLAELYREAERSGEQPAAVATLVVIRPRWQVARPELLFRRVLLGEVVRTAFSGGETLAALGPRGVAVLARPHDRLAAQIRATVRLLADRLGDAVTVEISYRPLPPTLPAAYELLDRLARVR